jgi:hypothetical protein
MHPKIGLTPTQIDAALPRVSEGLERYLRIQESISTDPLAPARRDFQKAFNGFYKLRRNKAWQKIYYNLLADELRKLKKMSKAVSTRFWRTSISEHQGWKLLSPANWLQQLVLSNPSLIELC